MIELEPGEYTSDDLDRIVRREGNVYGGAEWDWQDDPVLREEHRRADDEIMACEACGEPGEEYLGGHTYCPDHAVRAGRVGYR